MASGILSAAATAALGEGITLVFSRWTALQIPLQHDLCSPHGARLVNDLVAEVLDLFVAAGPKGELYADNLEDLLHERLESPFETWAEDGSVDEVAEKLMVIHEECLSGDFSSVEKLRASSSPGAAVAQSRRDDASSADEEDGSGVMDIDEVEPRILVSPAVDSSKPRAAQEDGWSVVASRWRSRKKCPQRWFQLS